MAGLNVIALVSGGKDSFFSALHCLENGHRLVALANLHPPLPKPPPPPSTVGVSGSPDGDQDASGQSLRLRLAGLDLQQANNGNKDDDGQQQDETDLNSFMYQTVGHQVIPLYAEATGLPLFRQPILGGAVQSARDYSTAKVAAAAKQGGAQDEDETESLVPLLKAVMAQHPEANALSAGAILSTYQRTRVESVALRLGLTPLAYLWKYPVLPPPSSISMGGTGVPEEAQLLFDMAATGLDVRMIKVASGGLDETFLWENVASARGVMRLKKAMGMFGSAGMDTGAVLGEGGEFETLVVDGPKRLFKKRLVVKEQDRDIVREGGGAAWVKVKHAEVVNKEYTDDEGQSDAAVRKPDMFDERFSKIIKTLSSDDTTTDNDNEVALQIDRAEASLHLEPTSHIETWTAIRPQTNTTLTIQEETTHLVNDIRSRLTAHNLSPTSILSTIIILRSMADFPAINAIYGSLFADPNPPSRVTIACGDLIPQSSTNIVIYLTLNTMATVSSCSSNSNRQGLHVQSRSYWAPANIGPYSQAITFPANTTTRLSSSSSAGSTAQVTHIAGQIPLIPATMDLPLPSEGMAIQLALSLQHLWRIGTELRVQWWTSGAVYFPRSTSSAISSVSMREKAQLAYRAWTEAHKFSAPSTSSTDDDDDEDGPDLWDRRFNPAYMSSYGGDNADGGNKNPDLPDYSVLDDGTDTETSGAGAVVPFFFAVEVDELPRGAEAEWHAHAGLGNIASAANRHGIDATVRVFGQQQQQKKTRNALSSSDGTAYQVEHCMLTSEKGGGCLHSVIAITASASDESASANISSPPPSLDNLLANSNQLFSHDLAELAVKADSDGAAAGQQPELEPYLVYVDAQMLASGSSSSSSSASGHEQIAQALSKGVPVIPCASIWTGTGTEAATGPTRAVSVLLYRRFFGATVRDDDEDDEDEED